MLLKMFLSFLDVELDKSNYGQINQSDAKFWPYRENFCPYIMLSYDQIWSTYVQIKQSYANEKWSMWPSSFLCLVFLRFPAKSMFL